MTTYIWELARSYAHLVDVVKLRPWTNVAFEKGWPSKHYSPHQADVAWAEWPEMNIGAIAWPHYWVLDLDGPDAVAFFESLCGRHGEVGPVEDLTVTVATPGRGGGLHLWWLMPELEAGQRLAENVRGCDSAEIKHGPSRYTAVPPSVRPEGRYRFIGSAREPQPTPPWLIGYIVRESTATETPSGLDGLADLAQGEGIWADCARTVVEDTVAKEVEAVRLAPGGRRNSMLYTAAHRVCEIGAFGRLDDLRKAARISGLDDGEIDRTIASARSGYDFDEVKS